MPDSLSKTLDSKDKDILRFLYNARRPVSGNFIASKINLSAPAIRPRLDSLLKKGYIRQYKVCQNRIWNNPHDVNSTICAPSKILWILNLEEAKRAA
jgi:hypothetical protein